VFPLLCVAPHPVLEFLTGRCPIGFSGRNQYIWWISGGYGVWLFLISRVDPVSVLSVVFLLCFVIPLGVTVLLRLSLRIDCFRRRTVSSRHEHH